MIPLTLKNVFKSFSIKRETGSPRTSSPVRTVLKDVTLEIREGEILCLLGKNGSGKTTLIKIISTLIEPDEGEVSVCGHDTRREDREVRRHLGVMLNAGEGGFQPRLSAMSNLEFYAVLYQVPASRARERARSLLQDLGFEGREWDQYQSFSSGMRRRLALVRTLLPGNPVLLLDEPTLGVDPWTTGDIHRQLKGLGKEGKTILCTTNNISEAKALGDRVLTLDKGELNEWKPVLAGLS